MVMQTRRENDHQMMEKKFNMQRQRMEKEQNVREEVDNRHLIQSLMDYEKEEAWKQRHSYLQTLRKQVTYRLQSRFS